MERIEYYGCMDQGVDRSVKLCDCSLLRQVEGIRALATRVIRSVVAARLRQNVEIQFCDPGSARDR